MDIYVGNLPYEIDEQSLTEVFSEYGSVESAKIIIDRDSGRSKGFGFVTMNDQGEAEAAIEALNGAEIGGRPAKVNQAQPKTDRPRGGGGGGGGDRY